MIKLKVDVSYLYNDDDLSDIMSVELAQLGVDDGW
jgi:hypothetical protein